MDPIEERIDIMQEEADAFDFRLTQLANNYETRITDTERALRADAVEISRMRDQIKVLELAVEHWNIRFELLQAKLGGK